MNTQKPLTELEKLPYNAFSVTQIYNDFRAMLHHWSLKQRTKTRGQISHEEALSIAHTSFIHSIYNFDPSCSSKGNTRDGYGLYLRTLLKNFMTDERSEWCKQLAHEIPERYFDTFAIDGAMVEERLANSDYGSQGYRTEVTLDIQTVLNHSYDLSDTEEKVIRCLYGLDSGEPMTLRDTKEVVGISHEWVAKKRDSALEKIRFALRRDIRHYRRKK